MTIVAAADGSALGNPGPAGWAWYVDDDRWAAGGWPRATNNQGELTAVLELLLWAFPDEERPAAQQEAVELFRDLYVRHGRTPPAWVHDLLESGPVSRPRLVVDDDPDDADDDDDEADDDE